MSQSMKQRMAFIDHRKDAELHEFVEKLGEIFAALCVIALPFVVWAIGAALA